MSMHMASTVIVEPHTQAALSEVLCEVAVKEVTESQRRQEVVHRHNKIDGPRENIRVDRRYQLHGSQQMLAASLLCVSHVIITFPWDTFLLVLYPLTHHPRGVRPF